jgi:hypothetical protein
MTKVVDIPGYFVVSKCVKIRNIKALCRFEGDTLKELSINENSVEIKIDFDGRTKPRCPHCNTALRRNKTSKGAAMDLPCGYASVFYITYPRIPDRCQNCEAFVTTRPKERHPTKHVTWRFMKAVSTWIDAAPISSVSDMFSISESTARRYDKDYLKTYCPETGLSDLRALLIDENTLVNMAMSPLF